MTEPEQAVKSQDKPERFVETVIVKCRKDKGYAAKLKRADNPATEYQCWEILAYFGIDLEKEYQRLPYATTAAGIAKSKAENNGTLTLGQAIASCYEDGKESDQAKVKLRRILACQDISEVCRILRPVFSLISSRVNQPLDYARILRQLLRFNWYELAVKAQWAQEFYRGSASRQKAES